MSKTIRVGVMPGQIKEYAVEVGATVNETLSLAELSAEGYDVKVDGNKVDPSTATIAEDTNLVLLVKQVKGNANGIVRVGVMPGQINEHAVEAGTNISELLAQANLDPSGYDVKVDGNKVDPSTTSVTNETNLVLLVKQVKGNM